MRMFSTISTEVRQILFDANEKAGMGEFRKGRNAPIESIFLNSLAASNCALLSSEYNPATDCGRFASYTNA